MRGVRMIPCMHMNREYTCISTLSVPCKTTTTSFSKSDVKDRRRLLYSAISRDTQLRDFGPREDF